MTVKPNYEMLIDDLIDFMAELITLEIEIRELRENIEPLADSLYRTWRDQ